MTEYLRGKDWSIVTAIRFSSEMEILLCILWELLEEKRQQSIDILASGNSVADASAAVRVTNVDGLIQEDDRGIGVPGVWVGNDFQLLVDVGWA